MKINEFVVECMKHCFICLDPIPSQFPVDPEHGIGLQKLLTHSLWSFTSYLKMDMGKVFNDNDSIPQHLLRKVRRSTLKGELCDECSLMNNKFSELYWKVIKIEMELASSLQNFQNKFLKANETGKSTKLRDLANSMVGLKGEWVGKLDILEVLRAEAIQKCSRKLNDNGTPRVKIENLTMEQVNIKTRKFKRESMGTEVHNFELESDPSIKFRNDKIQYLEQELDDHGDNSDFPGQHSPHDTEGLATSSVDDTDCSTVDFFNSQPKLRKVENRNQDLNNVTYSFEIVIPTGSHNTEKPHPSVDPESGKHTCNLCPREYSSYGHFKTHYDSAHLKVKYKCRICGIHFTRLSLYKIHHQSIHLGVRFRCRHCSKIFNQKAGLWKHQRVCKNQNTT